MSDTTFHLVKEAYDRATELLQLCNRARVLMPDTAAGESWTNDFLAYLRIQVSRAEEQNRVYEQKDSKCGICGSWEECDCPSPYDDEDWLAQQRGDDDADL